MQPYTHHAQFVNLLVAVEIIQGSRSIVSGKYALNEEFRVLLFVAYSTE